MAQIMDTAGYSLMCESSSGVTLGYGPHDFSEHTYKEGFTQAVDYINDIFYETNAVVLVGTKAVVIFKDTVAELICIKGGDPYDEKDKILWVCTFSSDAGGSPTTGNKVLYFGVNNRNIQLLANDYGEVSKTLLEKASELILTLHTYNGSIIPITNASIDTFSMSAKDSPVKMVPMGIADDEVSLKFRLTLDSNSAVLDSSSILFNVSYLDYTGTFILNLNVEQKPYGYKLYTVPNVINIPVNANPLSFNLMVEKYNTEGKTEDLINLNSLFKFEGVYINKLSTTTTVPLDSSNIAATKLLLLVDDNLTGSIEFKCYDKSTNKLVDSEVVQIFDQRTYSTNITNITHSYPSLTVTLLNDSVVFSSKFKESADDTIWRTKTQATVLVKNKGEYMTFVPKSGSVGRTEVAYINAVKLNGTSTTNYTIINNGNNNCFYIPKNYITSDCIIEALVVIVDAEGNTDNTNWVSLNITILDKVLTGELSLNVIPELVVSSAGKPTAGFENASFEIWNADTNTRYTDGNSFFAAFPNAYIVKDGSETIRNSSNTSFTYNLPTLTNSQEILFTLYNQVNGDVVNYGTLKIIYTPLITPKDPEPTNKIYVKYLLSNAQTTSVNAPIGSPDKFTSPATNTTWGTWSDPTQIYPLIWQSLAIYNSKGVLVENWTKPVVINANNQQYKYKRFTTLQSGTFSYKENDGWEDTALGVTSTQRYEYVCIYSNGKWGNAVIWAAFGEAGPDGSSTEYIYRVFENIQTESLLSLSGYSDKTDYWILNGIRYDSNLSGATRVQFTDDDYIPKLWNDNPLVLKENEYLYVCTRKKKNGIWRDFNPPVLWSSTGKNGESPIILNVIKNSVITIDNEDTQSDLNDNYAALIAQKGNTKLTFADITVTIEGAVSTTNLNSIEKPDLVAKYALAAEGKELHVYLEKSNLAPNVLPLQAFEIKVTSTIDKNLYEVYIPVRVEADSNYYLDILPNKIYTKADGTFDEDINNPIQISAKRKKTNNLASNFELIVNGNQTATLDTKTIRNNADLTFGSGILTLGTGFQRTHFCNLDGKPVGNSLTLYVDGIYLDSDSMGVNIKGDPGAAAVDGYTIELSNNIVYLDDDLLGEANCQAAINLKISPNITVRKGTETKTFTLTLATIVLETALLKNYLSLTNGNNPNKDSILTVSNSSGATKFPGGTLLLRYRVLTSETTPTTIEIDLTITILDLVNGADSQTIDINYAGNIPLVLTNTGYAMLNESDTVDVFITKLVGNNIPLLLTNLGSFTEQSGTKVPEANTICLFVLDKVTPTLTTTPMNNSCIYATNGIFTLNKTNFNSAINNSNNRLAAYQYIGNTDGNLQWVYLDSESLPFVYVTKDGSDAYEVEVLNDTIILDDDCELDNVEDQAGKILVKVSKNNVTITKGTDVGLFKIDTPSWENLAIVSTDYTISSDTNELLIKKGNTVVAEFQAAVYLLDAIRIKGNIKSDVLKNKFPRCSGTIKIPITIKKDAVTSLTIYRTAKFKILNVSEDGSSFNLIISSSGQRGKYTISANQILGSKVESLSLLYADDNCYDIGDYFVSTSNILPLYPNDHINSSTLVTIKNTTTLYLCKCSQVNSNGEMINFDVLDSETIIGIDDVQGLTGKIIRFRGDWNTLVGSNASSGSIKFEGYGDPNGKYIDIVTSGDHYYECLNTEEFQTDPHIGDEFPTQANFVGHSTTNWVETEKSEIVATKVLLADNAAIKFSQGLEIRLQDDDECIVGGARGGLHDINDAVFWAGSLMNPNSTDIETISIADAPFKVLKDGTLKASKAEISGKIVDRQGISVISPTQELYIGFDGSMNPEIALYSRHQGKRAALQWNLASLTSAIHYLQSLGALLSYTEYPNWYFISTSWLSSSDSNGVPHINLDEKDPINLSSHSAANLSQEVFNALCDDLYLTTSSFKTTGTRLLSVNPNNCLIGPFTLYLAKIPMGVSISINNNLLDSLNSSYQTIYNLSSSEGLVLAEYYGRLFTLPTTAFLSADSIQKAKIGNGEGESNIYKEISKYCPGEIYGDSDDAIGFYLGKDNINNVPGCNHRGVATNNLLSPSTILKTENRYVFNAIRFITGLSSVASLEEGYNIVQTLDLYYE